MKGGRLKGSLWKKCFFFKEDSHQVCTCKHTSFKFVLLYDICERLIFSANKLSASKWSSEEGKMVEKEREIGRDKDGRETH